VTRVTKPLEHIPELDGVRGVAIIGVLLLHFHAPFLLQRPLGPVSDLLGNGGRGVELFFVLSGFLITSILLSTRGASNYFGAFYARRALRILPLAFLAIAVFYWFALPVAHRHGQLLKTPESEQVYYWLFVGNWRQGLGLNGGGWLGHFWSLCIEEQFYLAFALCVRFMPRRVLVGTCAGMIVLSVVLRTFLAIEHWDANPLVWRLTVLHLDPIAAGALLACSPRFLVWTSRWSWAMMLAGFGIVFPLPAEMGVLLTAIGGTGLVAMALTREVKWLRSRVLTRFGKYSYAIYVLHPFWLIPPLAHKYSYSFSLMVGALILGPLVSFGIGWLSWNLLEKHMLALKRHFPYKRPEVPFVSAQSNYGPSLAKISTGRITL
jgi:peptidoglycan/LPS O-acetylase OafA/YrhL